MSIDPNSFLLGSGAKSASFKGTAPITYSGAIVAEPKVSQQTDFDTNEPLSWPNGDPKLQLIVQIQTDERDPADASDDGVRALYIKANSQKAVAAAVRAAGASGLEVGGTLSLTYTGDDMAAQKGRLAPPKLYSATYQPPAVAASAAFLGTAPTVAAGMDPAARQVQQAIGQLPAPAAQLNGSDEDIALIRAAGMDPANVDIPATANVLRTMNATKVA